jgi:hypothetical protein
MMLLQQTVQSAERAADERRQAVERFSLPDGARSGR